MTSTTWLWITNKEVLKPFSGLGGVGKGVVGPREESGSRKEMRHMANHRTLPSNNYFKFVRIVYLVKVLPRMRIRSFKYFIKIKNHLPKVSFPFDFKIGGNWLEHAIGTEDWAPDWTNPVRIIYFSGLTIPFPVGVILMVGAGVNFNYAT